MMTEDRADPFHTISILYKASFNLFWAHCRCLFLILMSMHGLAFSIGVVSGVVCRQLRKDNSQSALKGFQTFETRFLWRMCNSCCSTGKAAVLTLCKTQCRFMTNCCGLQCYHPFTLHGTQSLTNRKWQWRSPGARANWPVDLNKYDQLTSSPLLAWSWQNILCDTNGQFGFV